MKLLMKFGGTSVADAQCIKRVVDILEKHHKAGDEVAVVVSAQRGVTDQRIALAEKLPTAQNCLEVAPLITALRQRHMTTLEGAAPDYVKEVGAVIEKRLASLQHILSAIHNLRNSRPVKGLRHLLWRTAACPDCRAPLRQRGIPSTVFDGGEAGISPPPSTVRQLPSVRAMNGLKRRSNLS